MLTAKPFDQSIKFSNYFENGVAFSWIFLNFHDVIVDFRELRFNISWRPSPGKQVWILTATQS